MNFVRTFGIGVILKFPHLDKIEMKNKRKYAIKKDNIEKRYMNIQECCEYTGISEDTLYRWSRERKIPVCKISNLLKFDKHKIDEWINNFERESINADLLQNN